MPDYPGFRESLRLAYDSSLQFLDGLDAMPVAPVKDLAAVRAALAKELNAEPIEPEQVVAELVRDSEGALLGSTGGRFFGWVIGGIVPASLAADWLTSTWDQNAGLYASGPAAAVTEEVAGAWLKDLLGLPKTASFGFVTGCQMAHTTCLASARHALLARRGWDVEQRGLCGAPEIAVFSSTEHHGTIDRAVRLIGLGRDSIRKLPTADDGRLSPDALNAALDQHGDAPAIVLLQAGDVNAGIYDDFATLIPIAHRHGAWVHVDGAFGLWAHASAQYRHLVAGAGDADSWATDGHKWLNVPYDSGYAFVADASAHLASMSYRAPYLTHDSTARDQLDWTPEWSRRARGFATYAAIRQLGRTGIAEIIERCCENCRAIVEGIGAIPGAEVLAAPVINQGLVRFPDPRPGAGPEDHDRRTDAVIGKIVETGEAWFGGTTWRGMRAMRISVCNWRTNADDVARTVAAVRTASTL